MIAGSLIMLRTVAILATLTTAVLAHYGSGWDTTGAPGYGVSSYGDWNGRGIASDVASHNHHNHGPWFTGNGVMRGANWNNGYGYTGWNRWNPWYGPAANTVAAANDVAYDTYATTYANSVYGTPAYPSRYTRSNYETTAWPSHYDTYAPTYANSEYGTPAYPSRYARSNYETTAGPYARYN